MRHAFLIMVHKDAKTLETLITLLDSPNNDIYMHVDGRVKDFDFDLIGTFARRSKVIFTDRLRVYWGDYSQVKAELMLLKNAIGGV